MAHFSIFGYYGQGNAGDEAILAALIDGIQLHMPDSTIGVYSANPNETSKTHRVNALQHFSLDLVRIIKGVLGRSRKGYIQAYYYYRRRRIIF
jgi:polysaccharide pyruvyl transferase WcaK-like protein